MTISVNPKPEARRPKSDGTRKGQTVPEPTALCIRPSAFGFLSGFDLRISGFGKRTIHAFMLTEALVYIGLVFLLLGIGYAAMYRSIDNSVALRRNADDIIRALHAGERWRADVRLASRNVRWNNSAEPVLRLEGLTNQVDYRFAANAVYRRTAGGPWLRVLDHVASSSMERESRPTVTVWRWELELQPQATGSFKPSRVRPLFTFLAVPPAASAP
jgi:hypothetical protein